MLSGPIAATRTATRTATRLPWEIVDGVTVVVVMAPGSGRGLPGRQGRAPGRAGRSPGASRDDARDRAPAGRSHLSTMTSGAEPSTRRRFTVVAFGLFAVVLVEVAVAVIAAVPAGLTWDEAVNAFVV